MTIRDLTPPRVALSHELTEQRRRMLSTAVYAAKSGDAETAARLSAALSVLDDTLSELREKAQVEQ